MIRIDKSKNAKLLFNFCWSLWLRSKFKSHCINDKIACRDSESDIKEAVPQNGIHPFKAPLLPICYHIINTMWFIILLTSTFLIVFSLISIKKYICVHFVFATSFRHYLLYVRQRLEDNFYGYYLLIAIIVQRIQIYHSHK